MRTIGAWLVHTVRTIRPWAWISVGAVLVLAVLVHFSSDALLRRSIEGGINRRLKGYTAHVGAAHFHLFGFAIDLVDTRLSQNAQPNPPVLDIPLLHARLHWGALLRLQFVADFLLDRPKLHVNLLQFRAEETDPIPVTDQGWQQALQAVYPLKINVFRIRDADLVYQEEGSDRPLRLSHVNVRAENIRNIASPNDVYPSTIQVDADVFDKGRLSLDGRANFLATPHVTLKGAFTLDRITMEYFKPITTKYNVTVQGGAFAASGDFEYATTTTSVHVKHAEVRDVDVEYVHKKATAAAKAQRASQGKRYAKAANNRPSTLITIDSLNVLNSTFGFRNEAEASPYRLFLSETTLRFANVTHQGELGRGQGTLNGKFMGSGPTTASVALQPPGKTVNMDLAVQIEGTDLTTSNPLLRDALGFDVAAGTFAFYADIRVRSGRVSGSITPIFTDVKVVTPQKDAREGLAQKVKDRIVAFFVGILKTPNREIATTVTLTGNLHDPSTVPGRRSAVS
ncbi:MAG: DUF748 domain-containing protein [Nitrospira sp.]